MKQQQNINVCFLNEIIRWGGQIKNETVIRAMTKKQTISL